MSVFQTQIQTQFEQSIQLLSQHSEYITNNPSPPSTSPTTITNDQYPKTTFFPLQNLPPELRHEIYAHYFTNLPPHHITCKDLISHREKQQKNPDPTSNITTDESSLPLFHTQSPVYLSSPFLGLDFPAWLYYQYTTFTFSCPSALKSFSSPTTSTLTSSPTSTPSSFHPHTFVRKIRIEYGVLGSQGPDWVYLILKAFERLEEVIFVVDEGCVCCGVGSERMVHWWGCVGDAFSEGCGMGKGVRLRLEVRRRGECGVKEG